ncbi:MAG: ChrR family anti-sigma-E factor [Pseudomonadota bacterium]
MPTHLPSTEMLVDYASGAASPGSSLLIAAHLEQAPESCRQVSELERIGGAVLSGEAPEAMSAGALAGIFDKIDQGVAGAEPAPIRGAGPLPQPVIDAVGLPFDAIPWRFRLPGVSEYVLQEYEPEKVSLLRAKPGASVPQHTHTGPEMTLVMTGALQDGETVFRAGDIAINDEDDDHRPQIIGDEVCYCLIVMEGSLHFTGRFSRALNFLTD